MKRRALFRLDLTPLIDVVFLLLIFFLVTSIFRKDQTTIPLQLPPVGAAATEVPVRPMQVELSATQLAVGGKVVSFETFDRILAGVGNPEVPVSVKIGSDVRYDRVAQLLETLRRHRMQKLDLVQRVEEKP